MQRLEVSGAVRLIYKSLGVKRLMEHGYSRYVFEKKKCKNVKFQEHPSSWSQVFPCGRADAQTDTHDEGDTRFSQFCERA